MARILMVALGVVLWGTFAIAATSLYLIGHWVAPTVTLMIGVPLLAYRLMPRRSPKRAWNHRTIETPLRWLGPGRPTA